MSSVEAGYTNANIYFVSGNTGDTNPPYITIHNPANTTLFGCKMIVVLNVTANETINTYWFNLNNSVNNYTFTSPTNILVGNDSNYLKVWGNDSYGNIGLATRYFNFNQTCFYNNATGVAYLFDTEEGPDFKYLAAAIAALIVILLAL